MTHMALVELEKAGILQFVISQVCIISFYSNMPYVFYFLKDLRFKMVGDFLFFILKFPVSAHVIAENKPVIME